MKKVIIGFIAGIIFATAGTSFAADAIEKITASVRTDYSVEVDGVKVELTNAPLAYNGSSYLPVRELSELLGKDVGFEDNTIKLTTVEVEDEPKEEVIVPVEEILTKNQYDASIISLTAQINNNKAQIMTHNSILLDMTDDEKDSERAITLRNQLVDLEEKLIQSEQSITDLKAKYPEYAE